MVRDKGVHVEEEKEEEEEEKEKIIDVPTSKETLQCINRVKVYLENRSDYPVKIQDYMDWIKDYLNEIKDSAIIQLKIDSFFYF